MKLVIIESPYFNKNNKILNLNIKYARECMKECLYNDEAPYLSHLLYTQILDDNIIEERTFGINAGFEFRKQINTTIVYTDLGITDGMYLGILNALKNKNKIEYRSLKDINNFISKNLKNFDVDDIELLINQKNKNKH